MQYLHLSDSLSLSLILPTLTNMQFSTTRFNSTCADVYADAINGTCAILFHDSNKVYHYNNVSRRAILNLVMNPNMSTGFWLNANVLNNPRVVAV